MSMLIKVEPVSITLFFERHELRGTVRMQEEIILLSSWIKLLLLFLYLIEKRFLLAIRL